MPKQKRFCKDCNVESNANHFSSRSHKKIKRFKKLLGQNCITLTEIGARLGFTRERARQIADQLGVKGHDRRKVCTVTQRERKRRAAIEASPFIKAARTEANSRGWSVEPVAKRQAIINNKLVQFASLFRRDFQNKEILQTGRMNRFKGDVGVFYGDGVWLIFPAHQMKNRTLTMFSEHEPPNLRGKTHRARHDWRQFINAFHFLD